MVLSQILPLCTLAALSLATPVPSPGPNPFNWRKTTRLLAFGDSYTYILGTHGHPNYSFIGDALSPTFTPATLLSSRIVQNFTATAEGGPNWVELLTGCGVEPGLTDPRGCERQLWDFAYAGANTVSEEGFTPAHHDHTLSLEGQVAQFEAWGDPALVSSGSITRKSEVLIALWIGINDVNDLMKLRGPHADFEPLYERVQIRLWEMVGRLYARGYRTFLVLNLPPLDRGPAHSVNGTLISSFNSILAEHADAFRAAHGYAHVMLFDVNGVLNGVLDDYESYGFGNVTGYCGAWDQPDVLVEPGRYGCERLERYFWFNEGHLSSRTHEVFTEVLRRFLERESGGSCDN